MVAVSLKNKQKTAYEISLCDWSSDVCSSDLYRGQTAQRTSAPGMGLGLYICRALVEAHGGRIWATSRPGEEVVFSFTLPL